MDAMTQLIVDVEVVNGSSVSTLKVNITAFANPKHNDYNHIFIGNNNKKWIVHNFETLGKTPSEVAPKVLDAFLQFIKKGNLSKNGCLSSNGVYKVQVSVDSEIVEICGIVKNGVVKIGTAYVPNP